jgi:23S rRNA pseudouridine2605 synthase
VVHGDQISVDGKPVQQTDKVYFMMNRPRGLVITVSDEEDRPIVYALLDPELPWVAPVGRLDQASEGLLLFTNDSEWAGQITSPASGVAKTYRVQISVIADDESVGRIKTGRTRREGSTSCGACAGLAGGEEELLGRDNSG